MVGLSSGVTIWMLCLLSWKLTAVTSQPIETGSDNSFSGHGRYKRSMPTVLEKLLSGAKLLMNNGDYKLFSRPGGYAKAKADFEALGLTNIRQSKLVTMVCFSPGVTIVMLCLLSWKLAIVTLQPIESGSDDRLSGHGRNKRSMPTVLGKLFAGAKLKLNTGDYKLFVRSGGYAQARDDFAALGLTDVKHTKFGFEGHVEDRTVLLRRALTGDGVIDIKKATKLKDGSVQLSEIDRIRYSTFRHLRQ